MTREGNIRIVEATAHELVVLKPAGLACELPRDAGADSLVRRLGAQGYAGLRLVHRLDAPTCGLMLVARTAEAAAHYAAEIAARRWQKWYVAQVALPLAEAERLVGPHKAYLKTEGTGARVVRSGGKPSFLDVTLATAAPGTRNESHLLVQLHTGRLHQIRVMLAHVGAPLTGDTRYGGPEGRFYLEQVMLGARRFESLEWRVWTAPGHADRVRWAAALTEAVEARAGELSGLKEDGRDAAGFGDVDGPGGE